MGFKGNKALIKMLSTKSTLTDWFDDLEHDKKEPDKITTEFDLLVLSCCSYRLNKQAKKYTITQLGLILRWIVFLGGLGH